MKRRFSLSGGRTHGDHTQTRTHLRCKPQLSTLEDRCTPTVDTVALFGIAPASQALGGIAISGLIHDTVADPTVTNGLTATYTASDSQGNVIAFGPLTLDPLTNNVIRFTSPVGAAVNVGDATSITVVVSDLDNTVAASTTVAIPAQRGLTAVGIDVNSPALGGEITGSSIGRLNIRNSPNGDIAINGNGSALLSTSPGLLGGSIAQAQGSFNLNFSRQGALSVGLNGKTALQLNVAAAPTTILNATLQGHANLKFDTVSRAFSVGAKGHIGVTATGAFGNVNAAACLSLNVASDGMGHLAFGLSGPLKLHGQLNV